MELVLNLIKELVLNYSLSNLDDIANKFEFFDLNNLKSLEENVLSNIYNDDVRKKFELILNHIKKEPEKIPPIAIYTSLKTAIYIEKHKRSYQKIETLWSGPDTKIIPMRRNDMALFDLINSSKKHLLIVSYYVYKVDYLIKELVKAIDRGVKIKIILEESKNHNIKEIMEQFSVIKSKAEFFIWDKNKRLKDNNNIGILHVKCAISDENILYLSSANLTDYAMNLNMELGFLITGGEQPKKISSHFEELIKNKILVLIKS